MRAAAFEARRCFVTTREPQLRDRASRDDAFRQTVLRRATCRSPTVPRLLRSLARQARLCRNVVAGATVFEALRAHPRAGPLDVLYFFADPRVPDEVGGTRLNCATGALRCVGHEGVRFGRASLSGRRHVEPHQRQLRREF
jgi:hypothetical protein